MPVDLDEDQYIRLRSNANIKLKSGKINYNNCFYADLFNAQQPIELLIKAYLRGININSIENSVSLLILKANFETTQINVGKN